MPGAKRTLDGRVLEAPTKDGFFRPVQVVSQRGGKFIVRPDVEGGIGSADGEWDVDGPDIRERGARITSAEVGDRVMVICEGGVSDTVEAEVLSMIGDSSLRVKMVGSGEERDYPLESAYAVGPQVGREELLVMCRKRDSRGVGSGDEEEGGCGDTPEPEKKGVVKMNSFSVDEIDVEQLINGANQPPPSRELLEGIPVYVEGGGTCKGETISGLLKCNPAGSRWVVLVEKSSLSDIPRTYALGDFVKDFLQIKIAARTAIMCTATKKPVIPEYEDLAMMNRKWYTDNYGGGDDKKPKEKKEKSTSKKSASKKKEGDGDLVSVQPFNIPEWRFEPVEPDPRGVMLSPWDRAPQLRLAEENLSVSGYKGYRIIRATHGITEGAWYCEATIREDFPQVGVADKFLEVKGHCRLGWARSSAFIQAPVGYDRFGYAVCSKTGNKVHMRKPEKYAPPFTAGDTVGFYMYLPPKDGSVWNPEAAAAAAAAVYEPKEDESAEMAEKKKTVLKGTVSQPGGQSVDVSVVEVGATFGAKLGEGKQHKKRDQLEWKATGKFYYLDEDKDKGFHIHEGSSVRFFVNGVDSGVAYTDIQAGVYYPAASLYMGGHVTYNFGPDFKHPPSKEGPDGCGWNAISLLQPARQKPAEANGDGAHGGAVGMEVDGGDGGAGSEGGQAGDEVKAEPLDGEGVAVL